MKVVLTSDVHGKINTLQEITKEHQDAFMFVDCGDTELSPDRVAPFISVEGNNDRYFEFPETRVLQLGKIKVLVIHSHQVMMFKRDATLAKKARAVGAKAVFFGHYHIFYDKEVDGVRLISPGSLFYNRDQSQPSYAIVDIEEKNIKVTRVNIQRQSLRGL